MFISLCRQRLICEFKYNIEMSKKCSIAHQQSGCQCGKKSTKPRDASVASSTKPCQHPPPAFEQGSCDPDPGSMVRSWGNFPPCDPEKWMPWWCLNSMNCPRFRHFSTYSHDRHVDGILVTQDIPLIKIFGSLQPTSKTMLASIDITSFLGLDWWQTNWLEKIESIQFPFTGVSQFSSSSSACKSLWVRICFFAFATFCNNKHPQNPFSRALQNQEPLYTNMFSETIAS